MNHTTFEKVPFASGHAHKIIVENVRLDLLGKLYQMMGIKPKNGDPSPSGYRFPGNLPVSIERKHIYDIKSTGYLVTEKTDGVRHFLYLTRYDDKKVCMMLDRNSQLYLVPLNVYEGLYEGSVFDGELVKTKEGGFVFNVFDCVYFCGSNMMAHDFHKRFASVLELMKMIFPSKGDPFKFKTKGFFHIVDFAGAVEFAKKQNYKTDGYVFYSQTDPYVPFRNWTMYKWKPLEDNTVDFQVTKTTKAREYKFTVFDHQKGEITIQTISLVPSIVQVELEYSLMSQESNGSVVAECKWDPSLALWMPKQVRKDKSHGNDLFTFEKTVLNIKENIQLSDFC